jgi:hypothetical protein
VLAGGYADDVRDTVDINAATAAVVAARQKARVSAQPAAAGAVEVVVPPNRTAGHRPRPAGPSAPAFEGPARVGGV